MVGSVKKITMFVLCLKNEALASFQWKTFITILRHVYHLNDKFGNQGLPLFYKHNLAKKPGLSQAQAS